MYDFAASNEIPHKQCGKIVLATNATQLARLATLEERGRANGLTAMRRLNFEQIRELEPNAVGVGALHIEDTGIIDFAAVTRALAVDVMQRGGEVFTGARLLDVDQRGSTRVLHTTMGEFAARSVITCAGVQADRVARLFKVDPKCTIIPFRGEYYELPANRRDLVNNPIYPVPDPALPFLGVHFTPTIDGAVELGPNAVLTFSRRGYRRADGFDRSDACDMATSAAFWRMVTRHWKAGLGENLRSWRKRSFLTAIRKLVPTIERSDLQPGRTGVRAAAVNPRGHLLDDFHIVRAPGQLHVLNAPSPAATASLAIGRHIAQHAIRDFELATHRLMPMTLAA